MADLILLVTTALNQNVNIVNCELLDVYKAAANSTNANSPFILLSLQKLMKEPKRKDVKMKELSSRFQKIPLQSFLCG